MVGAKTISYLRAQQKPGSGWPWYPGGKADSNDTTAAVSASCRASPRMRSRIRRELRYLRWLQNDGGGYRLTNLRGSDTRSTA